jgi:hypothetical protein
MNANRNNNKKNMGTKKAAPKPYCKVCHDSGKSEVEYTSHWVKTKPGPDGVVVCPTLLAQECRYCHESGHTPSCCKKLEKDNRVRAKLDHERERAKRIEEARVAEAKKKPVPQVSKCGGFAALMDGSDSDESPRARPSRPAEEFPVLAPVTRSLVLESALPAGGSYASMASKAKVQVQEQPCESFQVLTKTYVVKEPKPYVPASRMNWADMDSDSSDDEDW